MRVAESVEEFLEFPHVGDRNLDADQDAPEIGTFVAIVEQRNIPLYLNQLLIIVKKYL